VPAFCSIRRANRPAEFDSQPNRRPRFSYWVVGLLSVRRRLRWYDKLAAGTDEMARPGDIGGIDRLTHGAGYEFLPEAEASPSALYLPAYDVTTSRYPPHLTPRGALEEAANRRRGFTKPYLPQQNSPASHTALPYAPLGVGVAASAIQKMTCNNNSDGGGCRAGRRLGHKFGQGVVIE